MGVPYAEVIGDPVARSRSPAIHAYWLERLGIAGDYRATRVTAKELSAYLAARRADPDWRGCNVTMPHKQAILPLLDAPADNVGAVNCVLPRSGRLVGINTDKDGVLAATLSWKICPDDAALCLIGAGGAAAALVRSLDSSFRSDLRLIVRDRAKGAAFLASNEVNGTVFGFDEAARAMRGCAGVVNASPLGMTGFPAMPQSVLDGFRGMAQGRYAMDMVTSPVETPFVRRGRESGLTVSDGLVMLVGQARSAFEQFFGARPPPGDDVKLRELLSQ